MRSDKQVRAVAIRRSLVRLVNQGAVELAVILGEIVDPEASVDAVRDAVAELDALLKQDETVARLRGVE